MQPMQPIHCSNRKMDWCIYCPVVRLKLTLLVALNPLFISRQAIGMQMQCKHACICILKTELSDVIMSIKRETIETKGKENARDDDPFEIMI